MLYWMIRSQSYVIINIRVVANKDILLCLFEINFWLFFEDNSNKYNAIKNTFIYKTLSLFCLGFL